MKLPCFSQLNKNFCHKTMCASKPQVHCSHIGALQDLATAPKIQVMWVNFHWYQDIEACLGTEDQNSKSWWDCSITSDF